MEIKYPLQDVYVLSVEETVTSFNTNIEKGITTSEAISRTKQFGANIFEAQKQKSIWMMLLLQFKSPIVDLLVVAALVTLYFENYIEASAIAVVILLAAIIGFLWSCRPAVP